MPSKSSQTDSELVLVVTSESNVISGVGLAIQLAKGSGYHPKISIVSDSPATLKKRVLTCLEEIPSRLPYDTASIQVESLRESDLFKSLSENSSLRLLLVPGLDQLNDQRRGWLKKAHATVVCFEAHPGLESLPQDVWLLGEDYRQFGQWICTNLARDCRLKATNLQEVTAKNLTATTESTQVTVADDEDQSPQYHGPADWILMSTSASEVDAAIKIAKKAIDAAVGPVLLVRGEAAWTQLFFEQQLPALASKYVPQMERKGRQELAQRLQTYSRLDFEFLALICGSTFLASFGLVQNSAAVIIGAMLVAPLMTPLLGAGLSLANGNRPLFWRSLKTIAIGFCAALATSFLFGLLVRFAVPSILNFRESGLLLTDEMWSRTHPTAIDFLVGLVGGSAAAFARTRMHLADALAGAAIAAALVPPLATAGLHLAFTGLSILPQHADEPVSGLFYGPIILFVANVVTIIIGSSFVLWACGLRGYHQHSDRERWTTIMTMVLMLLATAVLVLLFQKL